MNVSHQKQNRRVVPFIKHIETMKSAKAREHLKKGSTKVEQKHFARSVVMRIMARIERI